MQRILQRLYQGAIRIDLPLDDPSVTQGGQGKEKPQLLQGEDQLAH